MTLASGVTIRDLTIQGGTTVIGGNAVSNFTLTDLNIQNATDGISVTGAAGANVSNISFSGITGTSLFLNNQSATISNITINGGTNGLSASRPGPAGGAFGDFDGDGDVDRVTVEDGAACTSGGTSHPRAELLFYRGSSAGLATEGLRIFEGRCTGTGTRIEIDLPRLREVIKKARAWHSERLRVQIYLRDAGAKQCSLVKFCVEGDARYEQSFYNEATRDVDGSLRIRAVNEGEAHERSLGMCAPHFEGVFLLDKIEAFVKILPTRMVFAEVSAGMPIMLWHQLGGSADDVYSRIRFLVAPVSDEASILRGA